MHHERRGQEGTDVDIMAVRFPFRTELALSNKPMVDHDVFNRGGKIDLIIAEVKLGLCNLNGPWTNPERGNMRRVLYAIGAFNRNQIHQIARTLYENQYFEDDQYRFRLFTVGKTKNEELSNAVVQLTWDDILRFIHERFTAYKYYKAQHRQWDRTGQTLFRLVDQYHDKQDEFVETIIQTLQA